ncbi:MAG: transposase [Bacteroidota bacterium]
MKRFKDHKQFRLPYFNYASTGLYFVTICAKNRVHYFGKIVHGKMELSSIGMIADEYWKLIPKKAPFAQLDSYIVMPNHVHGIIAINNPNERSFLEKKELKIKAHSVSTIIKGYKAAVTMKCRETDKSTQIWQSRFYDRIIRNEKELHAIRMYIVNNPLHWEMDKNNPENLMM